MKKTISIIVALAMVFVMSFSVFAETESTTEVPEESTSVVATEKPTDPAELGKYYAEKFNEEGATVEFATEVAEDIATGYVTDIAATLTAFMENVDDQQAAYNFLKTVELAIKNTIDPDFELPVAPPGEEVPSEDPSEEPSEEDTLPEEEPSEDAGEDAGSGFLNTILGILGTIGDLIFGGGSDTPDVPGDDGTTDDPFGGDDQWGDNGDDEISGGESGEAGTSADAELAKSFANEFNANGSSDELVDKIVEAIMTEKVADVEAFMKAFMDAAEDKEAAYACLQKVERRIQESNPDFVLPIDPPSAEDEDELVSDTGDTTVLSVAAVAIVAGAALILTRKKSEDAE